VITRRLREQVACGLVLSQKERAMNRLVCVMMTALALMSAGSGCCCMDRYYYGDCHRPLLRGRLGGRAGDDCGCHGGGGCASGNCGGGCTDGSCGASCGRGGHNLCGFNPFRAIFNVFHCSSGCGEFYFDEWINDPPDRCDPCDECYGNYVGQRACPPRWQLGGRGWFGGRQCDGGCDGGCDSCTAGGEEFDIPDSPGGLPAPQSEIVPTPMPETEARRGQPYYTPATRKASYPGPRQATYSASTRSNNYAVGSGLR
jgi:hypothetical protein